MILYPCCTTTTTSSERKAPTILWLPELQWNPSYFYSTSHPQIIRTVERYSNYQQESSHGLTWARKVQELQGVIQWLSSFPNIPTGRSPGRLKCGSGFIFSSSTTQSPEIRMSQAGRLRHFNHVNHQRARVLWMVVKLLSCRLLCQRLDMPRHDATKPSPQKRTLMLRGCGQRAVPNTCSLWWQLETWLSST